MNSKSSEFQNIPETPFTEILSRTERTEQHMCISFEEQGVGRQWESVTFLRMRYLL
jgi:hypothetical protein